MKKIELRKMIVGILLLILSLAMAACGDDEVKQKTVLSDFENVVKKIDYVDSFMIDSEQKTITLYVKNTCQTLDFQTLESNEINILAYKDEEFKLHLPYKVDLNDEKNNFYIVLKSNDVSVNCLMIVEKIGIPEKENESDSSIDKDGVEENRVSENDPQNMNTGDSNLTNTQNTDTSYPEQVKTDVGDKETGSQEEKPDEEVKLVVEDYLEKVSLSTYKVNLENPVEDKTNTELAQVTVKYKIAKISGVELYRLYVYEKKQLDVPVEITYTYSQTNSRTVQDSQTKLINAVSTYGREDSSSSVVSSSINVTQGTGEQSRWKQEYSGSIGISRTVGCSYTNAEELARQSQLYYSNEEKEIQEQVLTVKADFDKCDPGFYRISIKGDAIIYEIVTLDYSGKKISSSFVVDYDYSGLYLSVDRSDNNQFNISEKIDKECDLTDSEIQSLYQRYKRKKIFYICVL